MNKNASQTLASMRQVVIERTEHGFFDLLDRQIRKLRTVGIADRRNFQASLLHPRRSQLLLQGFHEQLLKPDSFQCRVAFGASQKLIRELNGGPSALPYSWEDSNLGIFC